MYVKRENLAFFFIAGSRPRLDGACDVWDNDDPNGHRQPTK
jgi:hypothetical protein